MLLVNGWDATNLRKSWRNVIANVVVEAPSTAVVRQNRNVEQTLVAAAAA
jgi:hypothetical protein